MTAVSTFHCCKEWSTSLDIGRVTLVLGIQHACFYGEPLDIINDMKNDIGGEDIVMEIHVCIMHVIVQTSMLT